MTTIVFHGFMAEKYGPSVTLAGSTIEQLMNGLKHRFGPQFKQDVADHDWHLVPGDIETAKEDDALSQAELGLALKDTTLHLVPVFQAAKKFVQVIVGIILVIVGSYVPGAQALVPIGWSMIIGGVINLVFAPKLPNLGANNEESGSYIFNGAVNITSQGGVKPIIAGRVRRAGAVIISTDFSTKQIAQNTNPGTGSTDSFSNDNYITDLP